MKEEISMRLTLIIKKLGLNNNQFATAIGCHNSIVGNIINKRNLPSFELLYRIKKCFNELNINWLITGEGELFLTVADNSATDNVKVYKDLADSLQRENTLLREKIDLIMQTNVSKNKKVS